MHVEKGRPAVLIVLPSCPLHQPHSLHSISFTMISLAAEHTNWYGQADADAITADSTWEQVKVVMGEAGRAAIHTQRRTHTFVYGYRGVSFEVLKSGYIASMTLFHP